MDKGAVQCALSALERYHDGPPKHPRSYADLHEHVLELARAGLLVVVDEPINKDAEMHPLVRWQYRGGIAEPDRKAFLFTQPTDSKGRRFDMSVLVAGLAANRDVYRIGFGKPLEEIGQAWVRAIANPIAPRLVADAPCQEVVTTGADLERDGYVLDGMINTESLEPEAPFGESHGYVNLQEYNAFMEVTAITRRRHAILTSFISQVTPSESSVIRRVAMEPVYLHHLRSVLGIAGVKGVAMHEPLTSLYAVIAIQCARGTPETEIWRALYGAASLHPFAGKWVIAVDEDIEAENADALLWAMSYRCQPQHDLKVVPHKDPGHGPRGPRDDGESAAVLINAPLKGPYAPVALPTREFMEQAKAIWERLGLPPLTPQPPWHGYDLGHWPRELERQAEMAVRSDYFELGKRLVNERRSDVAMNTPIERE